MSNDGLRKHIDETLQIKETPELVEMWVTNDRSAWSDTTFEVMKELLEQRLDELPAQNLPVSEHEDTSPEEAEEFALQDIIETRVKPIFYQPEQVLQMARWINQFALVAIFLTILACIPSLFELKNTMLLYVINAPNREVISWVLALVLGSLLIALQCVLTYYALKALAFVLRVLMEMEYNSRPVK